MIPEILRFNSNGLYCCQPPSPVSKFQIGLVYQQLCSEFAISGSFLSVHSAFIQRWPKTVWVCR
jgi:hypothetical protein